MERNYATQMDAARRGIVTPELKKVAEKEYMAVKDLMPLVASAVPAETDLRMSGHDRHRTGI